MFSAVTGRELEVDPTCTWPKSMEGGLRLTTPGVAPVPLSATENFPPATFAEMDNCPVRLPDLRRPELHLDRAACLRIHGRIRTVVGLAEIPGDGDRPRQQRDSARVGQRYRLGAAAYSETLGPEIERRGRDPGVVN